MFKVFDFGFETRIKNNLAIDQLLDQWSSAGCWPTRCHFRSSTSLTSFWCMFQSVSPGSAVLVWFSFIQGWKMFCCSDSCCQTSVKILVTLTFQRTTSRVDKSTELLRHKTPEFTPDMWPPNRPDLSSVKYRMWRVIQNAFIRNSKGRRTSSISCGY